MDSVRSATSSITVGVLRSDVRTFLPLRSNLKNIFPLQTKLAETLSMPLDLDGKDRYARILRL